MKAFNHFFIYFFMLAINSSAANAQAVPALRVTADRCGFDEIPRANLEESSGRVRWAAKCDAALMEIMAAGITPEAWAMNKIYVGGNPEKGYKDPIYFPSYVDREGNIWVAPKSGEAPCNIPAGVYVYGLCKDGCVAFGTRLLTNRGWTPAGSWTESADYSVRTLSSGSTFDYPRYASVPVESYMQDMGIGWQRLLKIKADGKVLSVTPNHPWLRSDGILIEAKDLKVGESLLNIDLSPALVTAIEPHTVWGKVYNVLPAGDNT